MAHALLSASSAHRWMNCPPSARIAEGVKDTSSAYAAEGTLAHEVGEVLLSEYLFPQGAYEADWDRIKAHDLYYEGMIDEVSVYTDYAIEQIDVASQTTKDSLMFLESKLDFSKYVPEGYGTGDCVIVADGQMEIIDLKFGKGVEVSAVDNPQLMLYALGAYEQFGFIYDIKTIKTTIAQVRLGNISSSIITTDMLLDWAENEVKPAAELAFAGKGEQTPGDWCKFCKVKADCQARADRNLEFIEKHKGKRITVKRMAEILSQADELVSWVKDIKENAFNKALEGIEIPGFKLVEGRSNRQITDDAALADILVENTAEPDKIYKPKSLETLTALEKLFGKKRFSELARDYIVKPPGKPTLVPNEDKRSPINSPEDDFNI